jgi:hypothetical protein
MDGGDDDAMMKVVSGVEWEGGWVERERDVKASPF